MNCFTLIVFDMNRKRMMDDCKLLQYEVGKLVRSFVSDYPELGRMELSVLVGAPGVCLAEGGDVVNGRIVQVFAPMLMVGGEDMSEG